MKAKSKLPKSGRPRRIGRRTQAENLIRGVGVATILLLAYFVLRPPPVESRTSVVPSEIADEVVELPAPKVALSKGQRLSEVEFGLVRWPRESVRVDYIRDVQAAKNYLALAELPANLPVPLSAIRNSNTESNAVVEGIPAGHRAITVRVDVESAVEGWARSGNYVDVIVLRQATDSELGIEAKVIAENVRILSAGSSTEPLNSQASVSRAPATVTLLVSQEDALKIKTASNVGKLTFSLRGAGDESPTLALSMNQKTLLGGAKVVSPKRESYKGMARGPDGRTYVLGNDARWIRSLEDSARAKLDTPKEENSKEAEKGSE